MIGRTGTVKQAYLFAFNTDIMYSLCKGVLISLNSCLFSAQSPAVFFLNYGPEIEIQGLLSLLKVNKNKLKTSLNSVVLVHVFFDNYKEYPIYFFF